MLPLLLKRIYQIKTMKYKPVIGLEIHIQAKTKSKMFSAVSADYFGKAPNTCVDPVSLGLPGALPVPNKKALELCVMLSLALNCNINQTTKFDRKNYFYPDLPKGYQISQYDQPVGFEGYLDITDYAKAGTEKKIRITRVHIEEDTGKSIHQGNETLLDFNKAGVPLIEVVTEPDFQSLEDIDLFAKRLRQIVRYLGVSDADMEKGQMRYELNISLQKPGETELPNYKVEVKNIGSISLLQKVTEFEIKRQAEILDKGEVPVQETRGTRDMTGATHSQRVKEGAADYRYFPEPDIPPIEFNEEYIETLKQNLPALPSELLKEYMTMGLHAEIAEALVSDDDKKNVFEDLRTKDYKPEVQLELAKLIVGELSARAEIEKIEISQMGLAWEVATMIIEKKLNSEITSPQFKELITAFVNKELINGESLIKYIGEHSLAVKSDDALEPMIRELVAKEAGAKERFKNNPNIAMFFVGQVMKATRGQSDPETVKKLVISILEE
jgi:aspartyl-tRNA(Asn)/glutamyl-tRNA(Gln) amidotransferase subunit B